MKEDVARQLFDYLLAKRAGQEFSGSLSAEAQHIIDVANGDLSFIEEQAQSIQFLEQTLLG